MGGMSNARLASLAILLAVSCVACDPTAVFPTATPSAAEPTVSPTATPTPDLVAPAVTHQDPAPGGVLGTDGVVRVTFSEQVQGVDRVSFRLSDASGVALSADVRLDIAQRTATLTPVDGVTVAASYAATLTGSIRDESGNQLAPTEWQLTASSQVSFPAGRYTGYQFGASTADLVAVKRATLPAASAATASEFRIMDGDGYLMIDAGIWKGYWVHGTPAGAALDDHAAPIPPLPTCSYVDLPAARSSYDDWGTTVLDTVFRLPSSYAPTDLVDTAQAGLNGGHLVRGVARADLSALAAAAGADGARLAVQSAYRSYTGQVLTFNGWVSQVGYDQALQTSARPGHSEHQLGTAMDFKTVGGIAPWRYADWGTTTEGAWLAANAWKFGWLMSYPHGTSGVSCYRYEPWHYRYVGRVVAATVHDAGVTLREWLWAKGYGVR
jgi:D-alanyl-D-alanine carboxypeptidase